MQSVWDIFSSKARSRILKVLFFQREPTPLRHVALLADLPVYSVQNALESLVDEQLIQRTERRHNVLFTFNKTHPLYPTLEQLFAAAANAQICTAAKMVQHKARQALAFASSAKMLFKRVRRHS